MKIISGEIIPDAGDGIGEQGLRIASLDQEVPQDLYGPVFEIVATGLGGMVDLLQEYHSVGLRLSHGEACAQVFYYDFLKGYLCFNFY
jgi:ATP-binding cassette subfamily F protein uup